MKSIICGISLCCMKLTLGVFFLIRTCIYMLRLPQQYCIFSVLLIKRRVYAHRRVQLLLPISIVSVVRSKCRPQTNVAKRTETTNRYEILATKYNNNPFSIAVALQHLFGVFLFRRRSFSVRRTFTIGNEYAYTCEPICSKREKEKPKLKRCVNNIGIYIVSLYIFLCGHRHNGLRCCYSCFRALFYANQ